MAGFIEIVLSLTIGYGFWIIVPVLWRYYKFCQLVRPFKSLEKPHWFWGHLKTMKFAESIVDLYASLMEKDTGKMAVQWLSFIPVVEAIHPDSAAIILKSSEPKAKSRGEPYSLFTPFLGDGLVVSSGAKWERNRKLLTPAFHFDVLRSYVNIYNEAADTLLDNLAKQMSTGPNSIDVMDALNLVTLDIILRCSLSYDGNIQNEKQHPYIAAVHGMTRLTMERLRKPWHFLWWNLYMMSENGKAYMKYVKYMHRFADEIIAKRKLEIAHDPSLLQKKRKLDFLDIIVTAKDEDGEGLSEEEIRDEVNTFMFAGHDTTKAVLGWAIYNLGKYPEEQEKLYKEVCDVTGNRKDIEWEDLPKLPKMSMFLKETLRLYPAVETVTRTLTGPLEIEGVTLPAGTLIAVNIIAIHLRPDFFPNPKEFQPERFLPENTENRHPFAYIPFSAGPRNCIGKNFSTNEQKVLLSRILKRFKVVLDRDHKVSPAPLFIVQSRNGIRVRFEERR